MRSIWGFLLCTLAASAAAGVLLVLKKLLEDKLPPSWQYGVWWLLFARLALPFGLDAASGRQVLLPLPLWVESLKTFAEQHLASAYDTAWALTRVTVPVGLAPAAAPQSVTDWLFVAYLAGAAVCLARYLGQYARLRQTLRRAQPLTPAQEAQLARVAAQYGLPVPRAVRVDGLPTAFVCGVVRPVLALPDTEVDDKVLLHELLHLRHHDSAQSLLWCVWRAVHWCNPFLQYCFDRIGSDGEAACDQRVLELLQGEERRDYGRILLSMANERYARAAGTSSLANGGANVARRIKAIARFKRYPQGMGLVAGCIALMLVSPLVLGSATDAPDLSGSGNGFINLNGSSLRWQESYQLAQTRTASCTTPAGALDVYAKALWNADRSGYLLVSDTAQQQAYVAAVRQGSDLLADGGPNALRQLSTEIHSVSSADYAVWNLAADADGSYTAWVVWHWDGTVYPENACARYWAEQGWLSEEFFEQQRQALREAALEDGQIDPGEQEEIDLLIQVSLGAAWLQPVRLTQSGSRWTVAPLAEPTLAVTADPLAQDADELTTANLEPMAVYTGRGLYGTGAVTLYTVATPAAAEATDNNLFFWSSSTGNLTGTADPDAVFRQTTHYGTAVYREDDPPAPAEVEQAGMYLYTHDEAVELPNTEDNGNRMYGNIGGSSSSGDEWFSVVYDTDGFAAEDGAQPDKAALDALQNAAMEDYMDELREGTQAVSESVSVWSTTSLDDHSQTGYTGVLSQRISPYTELELPGPMPEVYGFTMQIYRNYEMQDVLLLTKEG